MSRLMTKPTKWLCSQWRLRLAWASAQSEQSSLCPQCAKLFFMRIAKTLIRLGRCPDWSVFAGRTCHFVGFVMKRLIFTVKILKIQTPENIAVNTLIWTRWLYHRVLHPKAADRMANSVDPDQTAPLEAVWSGSTLFAQACLSKNLGTLSTCIPFVHLQSISPAVCALSSKTNKSYICGASSKFVSLSIPSWQILTAHAQPFRRARNLAFCLKVPLDSLLVWASSRGSGETARMRRLAWTFAARIGDKYQIRLTQPIWSYLYPKPYGITVHFYFLQIDLSVGLAELSFNDAGTYIVSSVASLCSSHLLTMNRLMAAGLTS